MNQKGKGFSMSGVYELNLCAKAALLKMQGRRIKLLKLGDTEYQIDLDNAKI
jgi:hypothetical protein